MLDEWYHFQCWRGPLIWISHGLAHRIKIKYIKNVGTRHGVYLHFFVPFFTYHFEEKQRDPAKILLNEISIYGTGIARMNYQSQTSTIESIVNRWKESPECVEAISSLGISNWVKELGNANRTFRDYYFSRLEEVRREVIELYRLLMNQLEVFASISNDGIYDNTIRSINELNDQYNKLITNRMAVEEQDEDEDIEAETETNSN